MYPLASLPSSFPSCSYGQHARKGIRVLTRSASSLPLPGLPQFFMGSHPPVQMDGDPPPYWVSSRWDCSSSRFLSPTSLSWQIGGGNLYSTCVSLQTAHSVPV